MYPDLTYRLTGQDKIRRAVLETARICTSINKFCLRSKCSICSYQLAPAYLCRLYSMAVRALLGVEISYFEGKRGQFVPIDGIPEVVTNFISSKIISESIHKATANLFL